MNVLSLPPAVRATRLTVLVSAAEAAEIARRAEDAGLSVSAYLRARALGPAAAGRAAEGRAAEGRAAEGRATEGRATERAAAEGTGEQAVALRHFDALLGRMEADLDGALTALAASLAPAQGRAP